MHAPEFVTFEPERSRARTRDRERLQHREKVNENEQQQQKKKSKIQNNATMKIVNLLPNATENAIEQTPSQTSTSQREE